MNRVHAWAFLAVLASSCIGGSGSGVTSRQPHLVAGSAAPWPTEEIALDSPTFVASSGGQDLAQYEDSPALVMDGASYFAVWIRRPSATGDGELVGIRLARDGIPMGSPVVISPASNKPSSPAVFFDGANDYVVWQDKRFGTSFDIYGARVRRDTGALVDPNGVLIAGASGDQTAPAIAFDGSNYLVAWLDSPGGNSPPGIHGARIDPTTGGPVVDDGAGIAIAEQGLPNSVGVAFASDHYLVAWGDGDPMQTGAYLRSRVVTPGGTLVGDQSTVILQSPSVHGVRLASKGDGFYVAWLTQTTLFNPTTDYKPTNMTDLYGTRLDSAGLPIGGQESTDAGMELSQQQHFDNFAFYHLGAIVMLTDPAVIWNGSQYVVGWRNAGSSSISAAWVDASSGTIVRSNTFELGGQSTWGTPALASDGPDRTLVAYTRFEASPPYDNQRVWARFIDYDAPIFLDGGSDGDDSGTGSSDLPCAACSGLDAVMEKSPPDPGSDSEVDAAVFEVANAFDTNPPVLPDAFAADGTAAGNHVAHLGLDASSDADARGGCSCHLGSRTRPSLLWSALSVGLLLVIRRRQHG
jgi:MYXO-CTERM domain-containing protein